MIKQKLWSGRFTKNLSELVEKFTESISYDQRLALYDIQGSIAHTKMLDKSKILSKNDSNKIISALKKIEKSIKEKKFKFKTSLEDVHMNIESALIKMTGEIGKKLHTARSRNDQVLLDVILYMRDMNNIIVKKINILQKTLIHLSEKHIDIIMPGYTHLQQAQPVLISHYFMAFFYKLQRDKERFKQNIKSLDYMPLGTGAMAGVNYNIDRQFTAKLLNFPTITENSMDTISNRDFMIEFISNSAILCTHFSRLSEDLIIWNTDEFNFIEIDDSYTTGSSIMPNKKNPDVLELIRGKTGIIYGNLMSLFTLLKGLPLTYNRDLQEDKKLLFQTIDTVLPILNIIPALLKNIKINKKALNLKLKSGYLLATDIADYLVQSGVPFRKSHSIVGQIVNFCISNHKSLFDLNIKDFKKFDPHFNNNVFTLLDYKKSIQSKKSYGSTSYNSVNLQIRKAKKLI